VLAGYGAEAVHPYLALETLQQMAGATPDRRQGDQALHQGRRQGPAQGHVQDGHLDLHVLHRRADLRSVGLQKKLVDKYFTGTSTQVEGIGVFEVMEEAIRLHKQAFGDDPVLATMLDAGGEYAYPHPRRRAHVDAGRDRQAAALDALRQVRHLQGIRQAHQRPDASAT
jgi:glutamate synthase (NADPH/NADH) large chain